MRTSIRSTACSRDSAARTRTCAVAATVNAVMTSPAAHGSSATTARCGPWSRPSSTAGIATTNPATTATPLASSARNCVSPVSRAARLSMRTRSLSISRKRSMVSSTKPRTRYSSRCSVYSVIVAFNCARSWSARSAVRSSIVWVMNGTSTPAIRTATKKRNPASGLNIACTTTAPAAVISAAVPGTTTRVSRSCRTSASCISRVTASPCLKRQAPRGPAFASAFHSDARSATVS